MSLTVLKPGLLATVQDLGRYGYGKHGVITAGAMDPAALRIANWLVGNQENAAALEITWSGFSVRLEEACWIAITGGNLSPRINGADVPMCRPLRTAAGSVLTFHEPRSGCRAYLAVAGGLNVPKVMGSRSTYLRAGIGGWEGRALKPGDRLQVFPSRLSLVSPPRMKDLGEFFAAGWSVPAANLPVPGKEVSVRAMNGRQFEDFDESSRHALFCQSFRVSPQSDRMGYRLTGTRLMLNAAKEYISEAVALGTVQVPADGQPIILMADRQTLGGYPKIAQVASVDMPIIAQLPPGGTLRFKEITHREAEALTIRRGRELSTIRESIRLKWKEWLHEPS